MELLHSGQDLVPLEKKNGDLLKEVDPTIQFADAAEYAAANK